MNDNGKTDDKKQSSTNVTRVNVPAFGVELPEAYRNAAGSARVGDGGGSSDKDLADVLSRHLAGTDAATDTATIRSDREVKFEVDRDGVFYPTNAVDTGNAFASIASSFGLNVTMNPQRLAEATKVAIERVDIMPRALARAKIMNFLEPRFLSDDDKQIAIVLILKHFAMNSSSVRSPDTTVYNVSGRILNMGEVRRYLGDESRRFFRAFADETAAIIRADPGFAAALAKRYAVAPIDAIYCFDAADCMSNLTRESRQKIATIKANVLRMSKFDNRHVSDLLVEHQDAHGAPESI